MHRSLLSLTISLFLILSTIVVYWQVQNYGLVNFDDNKYITKNQNILQEGLTLESIIWTFKIHESNWHPLTWLSYITECEIFGINSRVFHITNLIFHILNTLLLFVVLMSMTRSVWRSAFVAALFALHPLHVESVAWISERKDVLSTFFWMLTTLAYIHYTKNTNIKRYILIILLFVLGLLSKPMLVTLPFTLLLLDYWPLRRLKGLSCSPPFLIPKFKGVNLIWEKVPLFVLVVISSIITIYGQKSGGAVNSLEIVPIKLRISNALVGYMSYIGKMFWPLNLAVFYPLWEVPIWKVLSSAFLLLFISYLIFWKFRRHSYLTIGWLWYLGTLIPVIGLVQVGMQSMADRYTYIPLIGLFIIITWGGSDFMLKYKYGKIGVALISGVILSTILIATRLQIYHWRNSLTLFQHAAAVTENNDLAYCKIGIALEKRDKINDAMKHYNKALYINHHNVDAHINLANLLTGKERYDEAISHYSAALRMSPTGDIHFNMGITSIRQGDFDEAIFHFTKAIEINPNDAIAHNQLGLGLSSLGNFNKAIEHFKRALSIAPNYTDASNNLKLAVMDKKNL